MDGERRYRAMKQRKLAKFTANVCEDFDEATLVAAMATDDKQPLSDIEKSRGVQQMLLLGVDPASVDKATRTKGKAKRVNHAMVLVDDAAEDMSLDRLLAIDEFADDKQAIKVLTNCTEKEWPKIADHLRTKKKRQLEYSVLRKELVKRGWKIVNHYLKATNTVPMLSTARLISWQRTTKKHWLTVQYLCSMNGILSVKPSLKCLSPLKRMKILQKPNTNRN